MNVDDEEGSGHFWREPLLALRAPHHLGDGSATGFSQRRFGDARQLRQRPVAFELPSLFGEGLHLKTKGVEIARCHRPSVRRGATAAHRDGRIGP